MVPPTITVEKQTESLLPSSHFIQPQYRRKSIAPLRAVLYSLSTLVCLFVALNSLNLLPGCLQFELGHAEPSVADLCPQPPALTPSKHSELWQSLGQLHESEEYLNRAVEWLGGAVRVPTESYDKMGPVGTDPRWEKFTAFHEYLLSAFPKVHATLALTKVNTYGLVYKWQGSDDSLKPLLLAAHQDVVPVNPDTVAEWTYSPFSGHFDGKLIWGRGSSDDKSGLIGILSTIETLLEAGFEPTRTVVLTFGFDEEASGIYGASSLAKYLLETYGENAFSMLVDEGGDYMIEYGQAYATPGIAEKGYIDVRVEVESPGGHSSVPPPHTSIGILSSLLTHIESTPSEPHLGRSTPMYLKAQCLAAHAPHLSSALRKAIQKSHKSNKALRSAEKILFEDRMFKSLVQTTQAIDLIQGGVKSNALPESAWAVVNHRIATDSSIDEVQERDTDRLIDLAASFNLSYTAFGKSITDEDAKAYGKLTLSDAWGAALAPAPLTPTGLEKDAAPFQLLAGTIKATHDAHRSLVGGDGVVVSPGIMSGNTDTRYYWKLTPHIFRYNHLFSGDTAIFRNIHTVNEFIRADSFIEMIRFFTTLILNADESTTL